MKTLASSFNASAPKSFSFLWKVEDPYADVLEAPETTEDEGLEIPTDEEIEAALAPEFRSVQPEETASPVFELVGKVPNEVGRILMLGQEGTGGEPLSQKDSSLSFVPSDLLENPTRYKILFLENPDPKEVQEAVLRVLTGFPKEMREDAPSILIAVPHFASDDTSRISKYALHTQISGMPKGKRALVEPPADKNPQDWANAIRVAAEEIIKPESPQATIVEVDEATPKPKPRFSFFKKAKTPTRPWKSIRILGDV